MPVEYDTSLPVIDQEVFVEMQDLLEEDFYEALEEYQEDASAHLEQLSAAAQGGDLETINEVAHGFASSSGHLGFARLHTLLRTVEVMAKRGEGADYVEYIASARQCYQDVLAELNR